MDTSIFRLRENGRGLLPIAALSLCLFSLLSTPVSGQTVPSSAEPERLEDRFKERVRPRPDLKRKAAPRLPELPASEELDRIKFVLKGVIVEGSTIYEQGELNRLFKRYLNRRIPLSLIYKLAERITVKYLNDGYILSRAVVIPQNIRNGIVRIQVIEGHISKISTLGKVKGPRSVLKKFARKIYQSRPLRARDLERYLLLMDDLPGVSVSSVLTPSEDRPGTSNLTVTLKHKPFRGSWGVDNRGTEFNGPVQFSATAAANSILGLYERTAIRGILTRQTDELVYISAFHETPPTSEGTKLRISGSKSFSEPGSTLKELEVEGETSTIAFRVSHPFIRSRSRNLRGHLNFKVRDSNTDILGTTLSTDRTRVLNLGTSYDFIDRFGGVNTLNLELDHGLNIFNATETGSENLSRADGHSDFTKMSGDLLRLQQLAPGWSLLGAMTWQYSFDALLSSEEFGIGGSRFVRGYDPSEITGEQGLAMKLELQYGKKVGMKYFDSFQAYLFYDYGSVWTRNTPSGQDRKNSLDSTGLGVRYNLTDTFSGYLEVDVPTADRVDAKGNKDPRLFFSFSARY